MVRLISYMPGSYGYATLGREITRRLEEVEDIDVISIYDHDWDYALFFTPPKLFHMGREPRPDVIWYSQWETTKIPDAWVLPLNNSRLVITASEFCRDVYEDCGVETDVVVVPHGVHEDFTFAERDGDPFTFLTMGRTMGGRKGALTAMECFMRLQHRGELEDAQMVVKLGGGLPWKRITHGGEEVESVHLVCDKVSWEDLIRMYQLADVFVYPTHGEGFGLEPLEAMATGACILLTEWSGQVDYVRDDVCIPLPYELRNFPLPPYDGEGEMAFVDEDALMEEMVWCYEHQDAAHEMGARASDYVHSEWTWNRAAQMAADAIRSID